MATPAEAIETTLKASFPLGYCAPCLAALLNLSEEKVREAAQLQRHQVGVGRALEVALDLAHRLRNPGAGHGGGDGDGL